MDIKAIVDEIIKETKAKGYSFPKEVEEGVYALGKSLLTEKMGIKQFVDTVKNIVKEDTNLGVVQ